MILNNKLYDVLKWVALIALPALGVFYFTIAKIPNSVQPRTTTRPFQPQRSPVVTLQPRTAPHCFSASHQLRSFSISSPIFLPYFSHPRWEKYGRNMGELGVNERTVGCLHGCYRVTVLWSVSARWRLRGCGQWLCRCLRASWRRRLWRSGLGSPAPASCGR